MRLTMRFILFFISTYYSNLAIASNALNFTACSHNLPPHTFLSPQGKASGLATEVFASVANELKWKITINYTTWSRARLNAENGKCDFIYTILKKNEYEEFAVFPNVHLADRQNVFLVRKDSSIRYDGDLEKFMRKYKIGLYADKAVSPLFDKLRLEPWAKIQSPISHENVINMLLKKRFDVAIENKATAIYDLKKIGALAQVEILSPPISITPAYIAFTKKGKALPYLNDFEKSLEDFKKTQSYLNIVKKYESSP